MNSYTFPIEPQLKTAALVDLLSLAQASNANITFDIKYATTDNFTGQIIYPSAYAFLMDSAALALLDTAADLRELGFGLRIFDAYRPWHVTAYFWTHFPNDHLYLADPNHGSRHNRGCAIDLSLYDLQTGFEVDMPSAYDEFNEKSHLTYLGGTPTQNAMRDVLQNAMLSHHFTSHPHEWWHFDFKGWEQFRVRNDEFSSLLAQQKPL